MTTVTRVITSFDDYPIHQTWEPIAHTESGDPGHYDRYFFNGYTTNGSLFFALAMGLYPNKHVMDAAFSLVQGGTQVNLRASARAAHDRIDATSVGPIKVEVLEPMRRHRIRVDSPEHAVSADLEFESTSLPYEEPPFHARSGQRTTMRYTRLTQLGRWSGWIEIDGDRHTVDSTEVKGSRDRSWGVRGAGAVGAPSTDGPQFYWLWAPVCFEGFGTVFDVNEHADGRRWHESGALLQGPDSIVVPHRVDYSIDWQSATRHMTKFDMTYQFASRSVTLKFEPIVHFQMSGLGYLHPEWPHGAWKGEIAQTRDQYPLPVSEPMALHNLHVQTLSTVTAEFSDGGRHVGTGVLETLVLGPHQPSGFSSYDDGR